MTPSGPALTQEEREAPDAYVYVQPQGDAFNGASIEFWPDVRMFIFPPAPTSATGIEPMVENSLNLSFPRGATRVVDDLSETRT